MKSKLLELLREHQGKPMSGQQLSIMFGVSRTAVWKAIESLRAEGYDITSSPRLGYELTSEPNGLGPTSISMIAETSGYLDTGRYYESIDSTNSAAKRFADETGRKTALIVAEEQTSGRGRLGREWLSLRGSGLYMTLLIRPDIEPTRASIVTQIAAVAVAEAIETVTQLEVGIKWPNDLVVDGKKICGILTELSAEMTAINYLTVGIGINVNQMTFPEALEQKATSLAKLCGHHIHRQTLLAEVVKRFGHYLPATEDEAVLDALHYVYRAKSVTLGKEVRLVGKQNRIARVDDITRLGELVVEYPDGERDLIYYGEVSVRGLDFYV
jgi:BirA family biotin operon repressor/biotin-[acetyl-CoA-carboxylase] ligase